jgi:hypothetical protein
MTNLTFISSANPLAKPGEVFVAENRLHLSVVLTLLLLLLYPHSYWYIKLPLSLFAIAALIFPRIGCGAATWFCMSLIIGLGSLDNWYALDNHKYLLGYWSFALFVNLIRKPDLAGLAKAARWMIGLTFLFAVVQKTVSRDYLDSSFIHFEMLFDPRFRGLAGVLGGTPDHFVDWNRAALDALVAYDSQLESVSLRTGAGVGLVSWVITWWNYAMDVVLAAAFLLPRPLWLARCRDVLLLGFLVTTYFFAPVIGFGWVLAIMGVVQTGAPHVRARVAYVAAFLLLQSYRIPWSEVWNVLFVSP